MSRNNYIWKKLTLLTFLTSSLYMGGCEKSPTSPDDQNKSKVIAPLGMVIIPGGSFLMGDSTSSYSQERPAHMVTVTSFNMDITEVTQGDYEKLLNVKPWNNLPDYGKGSTYPAMYVNWYDAIVYCNARSKRDNLDSVYSYTNISSNPGYNTTLTGISIDFNKNGYRLPTEAEWEFACRGRTKTSYYWGDISISTTISNYCWYLSNAQNKTHPRALKIPNQFGLFDMVGNVFEWCNDWYNSAYYSSSPTINPTGPTSGSNRVQRGGSWASSFINLRSAYRLQGGPAIESNRAGFRCVQRGAFGDPPTVVAMDDIMVSMGQEITITATGTSKNGEIITYHWARDGEFFTDTTTIGQFKTIINAIGDWSVLVKVRDDRGVFSQPDTVVISVRNNIPILLSPINGVLISPKNVTLNWKAGIYNDHFNLLLDENSQPTTVISSSITNTNYTLPTILLNSKTYYWQVVGFNAAGMEALSSIGHFITASPPPILKTIGGGSFSMGTLGGQSNEQPVNIITISAFIMDSTEITQKEYKLLMNVNPSQFIGETLPVEKITWYDAVLFCNARSKRDGFDSVYTYNSGNGSDGLNGLIINYSKNGYRLPTEAEWEYACRSGSSKKYYFGDSDTLLGKYAWYNDNANFQTHPAAQKLPNDYGLYDMHGNVFEWCNDWYESSFYQSSKLLNPTGPATSGIQKVLRGGSYGYGIDPQRSAFRHFNKPDSRNPYNGFRCVRND